MSKSETSAYQADRLLQRARKLQLERLLRRSQNLLHAGSMHALLTRPVRKAYQPRKRFSQFVPKDLRPKKGNMRPVKQLAQAWTELVGPKLAKLSHPVSLRKAKGGAPVVTVELSSAAATLFRHDEIMILSRLSHFLGTAEMPKLRYRQKAGAKYSESRPLVDPLHKNTGGDLAKNEQPPPMTDTQRRAWSKIRHDDLDAALALCEQIVKRS